MQIHTISICSQFYIYSSGFFFFFVLQRLIETPFDPFLLENYCLANLTLNQLDIFSEYYKRLEVTGEASPALMRYLDGAHLKKQGRLEEAAKTLKLVESLSPPESLLSKTLILLGDISSQLKDFGDTHQCFLKVSNLTQIKLLIIGSTCETLFCLSS